MNFLHTEHQKIVVLKEELMNTDEKPRLGVILCGNDPASILYTSIKKRKGEMIGLKVEIHKFSEDIEQDDLVREIKKISCGYHGVIVQPCFLCTVQ